MGSHGGQGYGVNSRDDPHLSTAIDGLIRVYPVASDGFFGESGRNSPVRQIVSRNAEKDAGRFWSLLTRGSTVSITPEGHELVEFTDGSFARLRRFSSTPNSPVVEFTLRKPIRGLKLKQKIHFETRGDN